MRADQALIENYWTALYTGNGETLNNLLAPDIKVTIIEPDGSKKYLNSSKDLIDLDLKISALIDSVLSTSKNYSFPSPATQVNFSHQLALTTKNIMHTEGYQNWTTKLVNDVLVLASLVVSEIPVSNKPLPNIAAKV